MISSNTFGIETHDPWEDFTRTEVLSWSKDHNDDFLDKLEAVNGDLYDRVLEHRTPREDHTSFAYKCSSLSGGALVKDPRTNAALAWVTCPDTPEGRLAVYHAASDQYARTGQEFIELTDLEREHLLESALRCRLAARNSITMGVDMSSLVAIDEAIADLDDDEPLESETVDPGELPVEWLRIPGFISEQMDFCQESAYVPNPALAFLGALSLQAFLGGRKVCDKIGSRTNLYVAALAGSGVGKEHPRWLNAELMNAIGKVHCLAEKFSSAEAIEDALAINPAILFQPDEMDSLLDVLNHKADPAGKKLMSYIMSVYTRSHGTLPRRSRANFEYRPPIMEPSLTMMGSATPSSFYSSLSMEMLRNGFFARAMVVDCGRRGESQSPKNRSLPSRLVEVAKYWADLRVGDFDVSSMKPSLLEVPHTDEGERLLADVTKMADDEFRVYEERGDEAGKAIWNRTREHAYKLSLIYAISENHLDPKIGREAVEWATRFVMHQTRRMLYLAGCHVAENPFDAECLKVVRYLQKSPGRKRTRTQIARKTRFRSALLDEVLKTLIDRSDVILETMNRSGRGGTPTAVYRLRDGL